MALMREMLEAEMLESDEEEAAAHVVHESRRARV